MEIPPQIGPRRSERISRIQETRKSVPAQAQPREQASEVISIIQAKSSSKKQNLKTKPIDKVSTAGLPKVSRKKTTRKPRNAEEAANVRLSPSESRRPAKKVRN